MECDRLTWDQYRLARNQTDNEIEKAKRKYFTENRQSLKKIIYDQLCEYLNENNILTHCRSGFRSLHSTLYTALVEVTNSCMVRQNWQWACYWCNFYRP